jgi:hypothetical protein
MTRQELRAFLSAWFCGCGNPETAAARLRDLLALHPLFDHRPEFEQLVPDDGIQHLLLYTLDHFDLTEHGGTVGGGWLTPKGQAVLEALNVEAADEYKALTVQACIHGYAIDGEECPECASTS